MLRKFATLYEDSLTEGVFTHLLHLPTELLWSILRESCTTEALPENAGELLESVNFRPIWDPHGTHNCFGVIPDMFMRFADFDLIIEAKYRDAPMQSRPQWEREFIAYINEYGREKRPVKMIALGGNHTNNDDKLTHQSSSSSQEIGVEAADTHLFICPVHMCTWNSLLLQCQRMGRELGKLRYKSSQTRAHERILADLIQHFACHKYMLLRWFHYPEFESNLLGSSIDSDRELLRTVGLQFQPT